MDNPEPGLYAAELVGGRPIEGGELVPVMIKFVGGVRLSTGVLYSRGVTSSSNTFLSIVRLNAQQLAGASVSAKVLSPSGAKTSILLVAEDDLPDQRGVYMGVFAKELTTEPGEYNVLFEASGQTPDGHAFKRSAGAAFFVSAAGAEFLHGLPVGEAMIRVVLSPEDCQLDKIEVRTRVDVQMAGAYRVEYDLVEAAGKELTVGRRAELAVGTHDMLVSVDASDPQGLDLRGVIKLVAARLYRFDPELGEEVEVGTMPGLPVSVERQCPR
jgi:hypothetical protein